MHVNTCVCTCVWACAFVQVLSVNAAALLLKPGLRRLSQAQALCQALLGLLTSMFLQKVALVPNRIWHCSLAL